jgi:beta-lactamase class A
LRKWLNEIREDKSHPARKWVRRALITAVSLAVISASAFLGWHFRGIEDVKKAARPVRGSGGFFFINPLLECEQPEEGQSAFSPLHDEDLGKLVSRLKEEDDSLHDIAIYYRDLDSGYWVGFNETHKFSPASIHKVPLVMAWFRLSEANPDVLKHPLTYDGSFDYSAYNIIRPSHMISKGSKYTVEELIYRSLLYSDNNASHLLYLNLPPEYLVHVYTDLGIKGSDFYLDDDTMDVRSSAAFFRVLFNSSYLTREHSELMLGILSQSEFRAGLVSGLPRDVKVAHKFGETMLGKHYERAQLHDCGIVYHTMRPYVLCVMAEGEVFELIPEAISSISRNIYARVTRATTAMAR